MQQGTLFARKLLLCNLQPLLVTLLSSSGIFYSIIFSWSFSNLRQECHSSFMLWMAFPPLFYNLKFPYKSNEHVFHARYQKYYHRHLFSDLLTSAMVIYLVQPIINVSAMYSIVTDGKQSILCFLAKLFLWKKILTHSQPESSNADF